MTVVVEATVDEDLVARVVAAAANAERCGAAPLVPGVPDVVEGRVRLHPWRPMADVAALLSWVDILDETRSLALASATAGGTRVTVAGALAGEPVVLVADTARFVPGAPGVVDMDALRGVAGAELAWLGVQEVASQ